MIEAKTGKVLPLQRVLDKRCRFELLLHLVLVCGCPAMRPLGPGAGEISHLLTLGRC